MDKPVTNRGEVPSLCSMCVFVSMQTYEMPNGKRKERMFCCHPRDGGMIIAKVLSCNLFQLLELKLEPKRKSSIKRKKST